MQASPRTVALIVAAGTGTRAGGSLPKQYARVGGKAILAHAVDSFLAHPGIDAVQVGDRRRTGRRLCGRGRRSSRYRPDRRWRDPARLRRQRARPSIDADIVLVHDAARPFVPPAVIDRLLPR
jgi:2-C-methyl-D-erythritol 4-phosphate cytidylyltransferase/2-C-methyl-D-erythritol 2,4-cyclodiphosphate synthase